VRALTQDARTNLNSLAKDATALIADARSTLETVDKQVGGIGDQAKQVLGGFGATAGSIAQTSDELRGLIAENRKPIRDFSGEGLYDLSRMIVEMRGLVSSLSRIAERLESDPSLFLFGGPEKGYQAQ
jgi:phospholipid/cholesterol/gamma-HCH transport system substrate-binding protein